MFKNYFKLLVFLGVFVGSWLAGFDVGAQTVTWTGAGDATSWSDDSNWSGGAAPTFGNPVVIDGTTAPFITVKVTSAAEALSLTFLSSNIRVEIADGQELSLRTGLTVPTSQPFATATGGQVGVLVSNPTTALAPGGFLIQHTGNQFVTIPRIASVGDVAVEFVTGTSGYISGDGTVDEANIFISAGLGLLLNDINDKLYINATGALDYEGTATLGGVSPANPAAVHFMTIGGAAVVDFEINEVSALAFGTVTIQGTLNLGDAATHVDIDPVDASAAEVNVLVLVHDLVVGAGNDANPITNGAVNGVVVFGNTANRDINVSGVPFITIGTVLVDISGDRELNLNSSVTVDGSPTAFTTVLQILNAGDIDVTTGNTLFISADAARNDIFATANGTNAVQGRIIGAGFTSVVNDADMASDIAIATNFEVSAGAKIDMNGDGDTDAFDLYLAGATINLKGDAFAGDYTAGASHIQFYGDAFQTVTQSHTGDVTLPELQIAKGANNKAHVTFATAAAGTGFLIGGANADDVALLFTSVDLDGGFVTANLSQVVINDKVTLSFNTASTGVAGIFDQTNGNGDVSGKGTAFLSSASFVSVADPSKVDAFDIGANLNSGGNGLELRGALGLDLGGSLTGNGFITTDGTANNQKVTFVTIVAGTNSIENMADDFNTAQSTVFTDLLDFSTIPNLVLQRDVAINRTLFISADDGAGVGFATILTFDGGSFVTAGGNTVFISSTGANQVIAQTANGGGFNIEFLTIEHAATSSIDLARETAGDFNFGFADVFITGADGIIDGDTDTEVQNIVFGGDVIYDGGLNTAFIDVEDDYYVTFDINFSSVNNSGTFLTVGRRSSTGSGVTIERLKVKGATAFNAGNITCFDNNTSVSEGLVLTTATSVAAKTSANVAVDLSDKGSIFMTADGSLTITAAAPANIKLPTDGSYGVIAGDGVLTLNPNPITPPTVNGFDPVNGKILVGTGLAGHIFLESELALAGDLFATVHYTSTGTVRLVGNNTFQTVAPGTSVNATGTAVGTDMGYIPNLIVDKCDFTTAFQSVAWNIYTDGFITVKSGIYDLNAFVTVNSEKGSITGYFVTAGTTNGYVGSGSFITTSQDPTIAGILFSGANNSTATPYEIGLFATAQPGQTTVSSFATVFIPNIVIDNANVFTNSTNLAVFNTASTADVPYALDFRNDPVALVANNGGGLDLNQNTLFITGNGDIRVRQNSLSANSSASALNVDNDVTKGKYSTQNTFAITDGFTTVTGAGTVMFLTAETGLTASRFTVDNFAVFASAGVELDNQILEITGDLTHNSFATAFITTGTNDGYVDMSATSATITFLTAELQLPALKVGGSVSLNDVPDGSGADLILGRGRSLTAFTYVLEITNQLNIDDNFITISGQGGVVSGIVNGGTKDNDNGAALIEAFTTVEMNQSFTFATAGVRIVEQGSNPFMTVGRVLLKDNANITFGGHLYDETTSFATADQFISGNTTNSTVIFNCLANTAQFISSNGGASAINANVLINGNEVRLGETIGANAFDNVMLYLGGKGKTNATAVLGLNNTNGANSALLNLNFNSVTFMTAEGVLYDSDDVADYDNTGCSDTYVFASAYSVIGFGTVTFTNGTAFSSATTLASDFGIQGDVFSSATAQVNLNGKQLYLGADYINDASITTTFTGGANATSTLVMSGNDFQTIGLGNFTTVTYTDIPHVLFGGKGSQLGSSIRLYGNGGDALVLASTTYLNGQFITVDNDGSTISSIYAESDAKLMGLDLTTATDGIFFATSANQRSTFTVDQADVFITAGGSLTMTTSSCTQPYTLNIGGDLVAINDVATRAVSNVAGGAFVTSNLTDQHGYVQFISTTDANMKFHTVGGISGVPALALNTPFATAHFISAPNGFMSITSNASDVVLNFINGNLHLNMTTVALTGTGNNRIEDKTVNNQVFLTAAGVPTEYLGSIELKGGMTQFVIGDDGNSFATVWDYNEGTMRGTFVPNVIVDGGNATLAGNLFTSALYLRNGDMQLVNNNIQFMTGGELNENLAAEHLILNSGTPSYTGTPQGIVFATGVALTGNLTNDAAKALGLVFNNNSATVKVELRKDTNAAGKSSNGSKIAIDRNYKVTEVTGSIGTADMMIPFATSEIGIDGVSPENLNFISFTGAAQVAQKGDYGYLSGAHGQSASVLAFNTAFVTAPSVASASVISSYITLGVRPVNIYFSKNADENPFDNIATTNGLFKLEYPSSATGLGIAFKTVGPSVSLNYANYGNDANANGDFVITKGQADNGTDVNVMFNATTQEFFISAPAMTTATFISVTPVDDNYLEGPEAVFASISNVTNGYVIGSDFNAFVTIQDNDVSGYEVVYSNTVYDTKAQNYVTYNNGNNPLVVTAGPTVTNPMSTEFITVNEFVPGKDELPEFMTAFATVAVKLRTQPMFGKQVNMAVTLNDDSEVKVYSVLGSFKTANYSKAGGKITFDIPFTSVATATSNQWDTFVSVVLVGVDDNEVDNGFNDPINPIMNFVEVKVNTNAVTTSTDYVTPNDFVPTTPGNNLTSLLPLGKVTIKGGNRDNERALSFKINSLTLDENGVAKQLEVIPSTTLTHDVDLTLMLDNSKDDACDYNVARATLNSTNTVTLKFKANTFASQFVTVSAPDNMIDDGNDKVLVKGTVVTATPGQVFSPNLFGTVTGNVESNNQFYVWANDDADVAEIVSGIANVFNKDGEIFTTVVTEADENVIGSHGIKLNSRPEDGETIFITVKTSSSDDVKISTGDGAETNQFVLTFNATNWNVDQFITAHVQDDDLKEDSEELIRIEYMAASSDATCTEYNGKDAQDFYIIIKDDVSDFSDEPTDAVVPAKVAGVTSTPGSKQVVLNWAPNAEAGVSYQVYVYQLGQPKTLAGETTSTNFTVEGLTNGVEYVFEIVAVRKDENGNIAAKGENSDPVSGRPSIILGTEKANVTTLDVYPNPSNGIFNVRVANLNTTQLEVKVLSVTGQEIYSNAYGNVNGEFETAVDLDSMPAGMYVLIVNTEKGSFRTKLVLTR